jgi:hypothetical protein
VGSGVHLLLFGCWVAAAACSCCPEEEYAGLLLLVFALVVQALTGCAWWEDNLDRCGMLKH